MGSPTTEFGRGANNEDIIAVTLTHPFVIQQFELTQRQWVALGFVNHSGWEDAGPDSVGDCVDGDCPAGNMTWFDILSYSNLLSTKEGRGECYQLQTCSGTPGDWLSCAQATIRASTPYECNGYRLPTEAEWEYAARAGTTTAFYSGDITPLALWSDCAADPNLERIGWYCWNSDRQTHPIGQKMPNVWGLYDMSGNSDEYTSDPDVGRYTRPTTDPWQAPGAGAVGAVTLRGGPPFDSAPQHRSANRDANGQYQHKATFGFRLVRTLTAGEVWAAPAALPIPAIAKCAGTPHS